MAVKSIRKLAVAGLALLTLGLQSDLGAARSRYRVRTVRVTRGLHLSRILDRRGPNQIRVLTVNPATRLTIDVALSNNAVPWRETTSSMARRRGAIAATNGTYGLPWGRPIGLFAEDGDLKTSPLMGTRAFALSHDEQAASFGHTSLWMSAKVLDTNATWSIDSWNKGGRPGRYEISALTPSATDYLKPPVRACSARLYRATKPMWTKMGTGVAADYVVDAMRCSKDKRFWPRGGTVVSARMYGPAASHIKVLTRKQFIRVRWSLDWPGVLDTIAGSPTLLENRAITATDDCPTYFCDRNPRTGVGITSDGRILLVTVDGRRDGSVGMTPVQFAKLFRYLGATRALNLDGGGSTTMVVKGNILNRPSDGRERAVSSALLVLPGADKGEEEPLPYSRSPAALSSPLLEDPSATPVAIPSIMVPDPSITDPASTGGLLEALSSGSLGGEPVALPPSLDRLVERFRASR